MGRAVKRVPMDFDASMDEIWKGYINPHSRPITCEHCDNITQDEVEALVAKNRLMDFTHTWTPDEGWKRREDGYIPTAEEINEANRTPSLFGHDAINRHILIEARAKRLGVYGKCPVCNGEGTILQPDEAVRKLYEEWEKVEPPEGEGWQLWETTSEGAPTSPVFASAEELAEWCEDNATIFADEKTTKENWLSMFVGKKDLDVGSMLIMTPQYQGAIANMPEE